jgi:hypothetical protein
MKKRYAKPLFKWINLSLLFVMFTVWVSACAAPAATQMSAVDRASVESFSAGAPPMEAPAAQAPGGSSNNAFSAGVQAAQAARLVIKNANLSIVVADPGASLDVISKMADDMGGFVVTANLSHTNLSSGAEVPHGSITIRVPAEKLNEALANIEAQSDQAPQNKRIESQDVTSEYTDLQSRLRNLEDAENQLRQIMDNAFSTEDVLSVYNRLVQVREEIEVIKGQIQYYEESAALSAISVELVANEAVQPLEIGGWQPVGVVKQAVQALLNTLRFLTYTVIWIVILVIPVVLLLYVIFVLPLRLLWRAWRKRRAERKVAVQTTPPQE